MFTKNNNFNNFKQAIKLLNKKKDFSKKNTPVALKVAFLKKK